MELTHQLTPMLRTLRLSGILETLDVRNRQAVEQPTSFVEFLTLLLQDASAERLSAWHLATASPPVRDDITSLR
jgi:hypothetical protein